MASPTSNPRTAPAARRRKLPACAGRAIATFAGASALLLCLAGGAEALVVCNTPDGSVYAGDAPPKDCTKKALDDSVTASKRPRDSHQVAYGLWECDSGFVIATGSGGSSCIPAADVPKGPTMEISPPSSWCVSCGTKKKGGTNSDARKRCAEEWPDDFQQQLACVRGSDGPVGGRAARPGAERAMQKCAADSPDDPGAQARCLSQQLEALQELGH
jgi:hypothetical protein